MEAALWAQYLLSFGNSPPEASKMISLGSLQQPPPKSMAASKSSCTKLQGRTANTRLQFLGLQFSCPALRFTRQGVCEIIPPAAKAGKAMKTQLGMLWEYSLFNYHSPNTIQRQGGDRKAEKIRNKNCCFPLKTWGQEQTQTQMQVSGRMQGPTLRD